MKQTIDELAGPATIVALVLSILTLFVPQTLGWKLALAGLSLIFLVVGFIFYRAGRRRPDTDVDQHVGNAGLLPRGLVVTLLVAATVILIAAAVLILRERASPGPGPSHDPTSRASAGPPEIHISPSPTSAMATVAGVPVPPAPTVLLADAGCPGSTNMTTIQLGGTYTEINFRVAIDDSAGGYAHVRLSVDPGPTEQSSSQIIESGSGTSISVPTTGVSQVTLTFHNLTHQDSGCGSAKTRVVVIDMGGRR